MLNQVINIPENVEKINVIYKLNSVLFFFTFPELKCL